MPIVAILQMIANFQVSIFLVSDLFFMQCYSFSEVLSLADIKAFTIWTDYRVNYVLCFAVHR